MTTATVPAETTGPATTERRLGLGRSSPAVPAIASGLLLFFAYPPADRGYLAWFALVPLLLLVRSDRPRWQVYLGTWAGGLVFWLLSVIWIWELHPSAWVAWLALAGYQSIYWPLFLLLARVMVRRHRLPLMLAAPIGWLACEYIQAYALTGFPWYYLAHSQSRALPVIQISDLMGAWGVSALVMLVNAWLAELLLQPLIVPTRRGPRPAVGLLLRSGFLVLALGGALGYGFYRLGTARFAEGPTVALLQSNIQQEMKAKADPSEILAVYAELINDATESGQPLDLIVWPETSFPQGHVFIEEGLGDDEIRRLGEGFFAETDAAYWKKRRDYVARTLGTWAREAGAPMLVGTLLYDLVSDRAGRTNAAVVFEPGVEEVRIYRKMHLVPFGEYVPLLEVFPWVARLTPYDNEALPTLAAGSEPEWLDIGGLRYVAAICFEDTVPHLMRRSFAEAPEGREPDVIVDMSNDGWFRGSAEHDLHLAICVFRAVEARAPLVRAVNGGYSGVIDGNGRIRALKAKGTAGAVVESVPLDPRTTFYTRTGDWLAQGAFAVSLGLLLLAPFGRTRRGPGASARS